LDRFTRHSTRRIFHRFSYRQRVQKADIIGLANAAGDTTNSIKQAAEYAIAQGGQKFAALFVFTTDINAIGLDAAQGLQFVSAFYWDKDADTRAFSERFLEKVGHMPTMIQAGAYSATTHYLKAVRALGSKEPLKVMAEMREMPINDFMTRGGKLRIDGRVLRDMYLLDVKKPDESNSRWDLAKIIATVPGEKAFRPLQDGGCLLTKGAR
jgi:branched-chain amino acid transport system substrate-binding protein